MFTNKWLCVMIYCMNNDPIAKIWNERNKKDGDPYKKYVLDPIMIRLMENIKNKTVLDQGYGNGHLAGKIARKNPTKIVILDFFPGNLEYAAENLKNTDIPILKIQADLNKKLAIRSSSVDCIVSNMVLSEIKNFKKTISESFRVLKTKGLYVFSVVHPAFSYKLYLKEKLVPGSGSKIMPPRHYFDERSSWFILGTESHTNKIIKAPHYQRTIEDYYTALQEAGFFVENIIEPKLTITLLKHAPRFDQDKECPIALVFKVRKLG